MGVEVGVVAGLGSVSEAWVEVHLTIYWQKELFESDVCNSDYVVVSLCMLLSS